MSPVLREPVLSEHVVGDQDPLGISVVHKPLDEPEPLAICGGGERAVYLMKLHYSGDRYLWLAIATSYQELKDRASGQYALGMNLTLALIGVLILTPIVAWLWRRRDRKAPPPA